MPDLFADLKARTICAFHDAEISAPNATPRADDAPWRHIAHNHDANRQLWDQEDLARRVGVPDDEIVGNKRAIDRLNQARNDAIERLDEALLDRLAAIAPMHDAWHNSETAGSMIDRLSILSLKIFHMNAEAARTDADAEHVARCRQKVERLRLQRADLARCLDTLLSRASEGRAFWRVYRQFKMYNDPALNPYLRK
jgi:hypothetical protein